MNRARTAVLALCLVLPAMVVARDPDPAEVRLQAELAALERDPSLGELAAAERIRARQALDVLAQARGDFFITVTITPQPDGNTEALSSIADSRAAREAGSRPLGFNLPAGSELLSDMESVDGPLTSRQLVLINAHALRLNLSQLSASLAARGLHPADPPLADSADALVQAFGGASGEAQLVLVRGEGTTHAILTLLSRRP